MSIFQNVVLAALVAPIFVAALLFFGSYLFDGDGD